MGVVYEGIDPIIGRRVAIKAARRDLLEGEERTDEMMERFLREARAAGLLNHPGIVTIYDADQEKDVAFIAMEYMAGGNLKDRLRNRSRLEPNEAVRIGTTICTALAAAHEHGVVHRDVKPANILMHTDGSIKVADFGIARISDSTLTQDGAIVGTPYCMSPEQVVGQKVDGRSDLFSVGVILYETLTGQRPFTGDVFATILHKIVHEDPVPPHEITTGLNENLSRVVMKSLNKAPERRYQDGRAMAAALRESLKQEPDPAVLGINDEIGEQPRTPRHDFSTVLSGQFQISPQVDGVPVGGYGPRSQVQLGNEPSLGNESSSGGISSFTPRLSRLMRRKTLLPAILTTILLLVVGVIAATVVLGNQSATPLASGSPTQAIEQGASAPTKPPQPPGPSAKRTEPKAKPKTEEAKPQEPKNITAQKETANEDQPKQEKPKSEKPRAEKPEAQTPKAEQPKTDKPKVEVANAKEPQSKTEPGQPEAPKPQSEDRPAAPVEPSSHEAQPPATPAHEPPSSEKTPASATTPLNAAATPTPRQKVAPPNPSQPKATVPTPTTPPPPPGAETDNLAALQLTRPPSPSSSEEAQSILAELPSVAQFTANFWFADTQEAWDAANNAQLERGERYALCKTTGTVTVAIRDASLPERPIIDTQTVISGGTVWLKTPCPQIHVTYTRDGYWPAERQYSADSPGQAVTDDVVLKNRSLP
jgi:serine/threonine protein kinase